MHDRINYHDIHLYRVVDEIRKSIQPCSAISTSANWKRMGDAFNPPLNSIDFHSEAHSQIRIYVLVPADDRVYVGISVR